MMHWVATWVWLAASSDDDSITPGLLLMVFAVIPALAVKAYYHLRSGKPLQPKKKRFLSTILVQLMLLLIAMGSANRQGLHLWQTKFPTSVECLMGLLLISAVYVRLRRSWSRRPDAHLAHSRLLLPENSAELKYWVVISLVAGIGEEYIYRGVTYAAVLSLTGRIFSSAIICALAFGAAHLALGIRNGISTFAMGLVFQFLVLWTGTLYLAMFVHTAYDLLVGMVAVYELKRRLPQIQHALPSTQGI